MRRLSDKIIQAHTQACDERKMDVAEALLRALEIDQSAFGGFNRDDKRQSNPLLVAAYARHEQAKAAVKH
ncbi:MAG TPA: hypothetical protein VGO34_07455 [Alphaproteobacteria bacterium]